jgi:hypothetical protein
MFRRTFAHSLGIIGLATILAAPLAWAQESPPIRVRGTIERVTLTLKYKDGEQKIFVPADVPVVTYDVGDRTDLKPGAPVFIVAVKQPDGTLEGRAWRVGRNGAAPAF